MSRPWWLSRERYNRSIYIWYVFNISALISTPIRQSQANATRKAAIRKKKCISKWISVRRLKRSSNQLKRDFITENECTATLYIASVSVGHALHKLPLAWINFCLNGVCVCGHLGASGGCGVQTPPSRSGRVKSSHYRWLSRSEKISHRFDTMISFGEPEKCTNPWHMQNILVYSV